MSTIFVGQTLNFDELEGSPSGSMQNGIYTITIKGTTSWSDRDAFAFGLMPIATSVGSSYGAKLIANPFFRVVGFAWEGMGGLQASDTEGLNTYRLASWTIQAHVPLGQNVDLTQPYTPPDPVPWLIHRWSVGGQYLTLPNRSLQWASDLAVPSGPGRGGVFVPSIEHSITWPRLLQPPRAAIRSCVGTINSVAMQFSTGLINVGQLMFLGAESEQENLSNGTLATNLVYKFSERPLVVGSTPITWNHFYRDDAKSSITTAPWDILQNAATNTPVIPSTNHNSLFPTTIF